MADTVVTIHRDKSGRIERDELGELKIDVEISPERAKEIRENSLDNHIRVIDTKTYVMELKEVLRPLHGGIIAEHVDYEPGEPIVDEKTGKLECIALDKVGSGTRGHVYRVLYPHFKTEKKELEIKVKPCLPYVTRKHNLELLMRELQSRNLDTNINGMFIDEKLMPLIKTLKAELRYTNPIHNYGELRQVMGEPGFDLLVLKALTQRMIDEEKATMLNKDEDSTCVKELKKERLMQSNARGDGIPRVVGDFIKTDRIMGSLSGYVDGATWSSIMDPDEKWWRQPTKDDAYKEFVDPKVVLAKAINLHNILAKLQARGVFYSDLKDDNLIGDYDGEDNLVDYGFAAEILPGKKTLDKLDNIGFNELFAAPEIIKSYEEEKKDGKTLGYIVKEGAAVPLDLRSTVFSVGDIIWWMIAGNGERPFTGRNFEKLKHEIQYKPHTDPRLIHAKTFKDSPFTDEEIDWLVNFALKKDSSTRPYHPRFVEELTRLLYLRIKKDSKLEKTIAESNMSTTRYISKTFMYPLWKLRNDSYLRPTAHMEGRPKILKPKVPSMRARLRSN